MLSDKEMFARMKNGWRMGKPDGTVCGNGSTMANTAKIRQWLPQIAEDYGLQSICDAGAGDLHWIRRVKWHVKVRYFDLIPRNLNVEPIDITRQALPKCDAILCRTVLNHLDEPRILMALDLFRQSSQYLIATNFTPPFQNKTRQFVRLDLRGEPYNLGDPLESCQDSCEPNQWLSLWRI